jgi:hypothetical protein
MSGNHESASAAAPPLPPALMQTERLTNDITANVRLIIAERFPKQDLRRMANEITRMCKKVTRLGFSESLTDVTSQAQKHSCGMGVGGV